MSAITPATLVRESNGSLTLHIADFTTAFADGDTWASGLPNVVGKWANVTSGMSASLSSGAIMVTESGGTFTFNSMNAAPLKATLYVLSRT